jgi:hypothetical protein
MEFTSQICTSRSQSERLLALGLKKETADMTLQTSLDVCYTMSFQEAVEYFENRHLPPHPTILPAWSLHRLIELCGIDRLPICFGKKGRVRIRVSHIHPTHDGRSGYNHYDSLIDCIEWLIKEGYFHKEYLEE